MFFSITTNINCIKVYIHFQLGEAMAASTQANAEMNLQQKLREDAQMRLDELEESLLEKEQEVQKLQTLVTKLQGEVCCSV